MYEASGGSPRNTFAAVAPRLAALAGQLAVFSAIYFISRRWESRDTRSAELA
ncbi:MAG: hypothetical protein LBH11_01270 [Propionibacteriaceae bacterium]|jgi:hypothetical protein|nr:hypothetical protein [Propionibacteriaceae bacterium]